MCERITFSEQTIILKPDVYGENIATLISSDNNKGNRPAVLYVHGFMDYFFHDHVAVAFNNKGYDFFALDLRKYGRSILPHQKPNYCENLEEYFEEISIAIESILKQSTTLFLFGHSTGCTTLSLYMNKGKYKNNIAGLILNSPFLEIPQAQIKTSLMYRAGKLITKINPNATLPRSVNPNYARTLHQQFGGEWDYDLNKKPINGFTIYFKWAFAIIKAQKFLQQQSDIKTPILILHSKKSNTSKKLNTSSFTSDVVLNVSHIKKYGKRLGKRIKMVSIKDGLHDLLLSKKPVREKALTTIFDWLKTVD